MIWSEKAMNPGLKKHQSGWLIQSWLIVPFVYDMSKIPEYKSTSNDPVLSLPLCGLSLMLK